MPGLVVLGRRWEVASDDLVFPSIIENIIRIIWLITIIVIWTCHAPYLDCQDGQMLQMYLGGVIAILVIIIIMNILIMNYSMKGSIMDVRARKSVPILLYIRVVLGVPEVVWTTIGSFWAFSHRIMCIQPIITLRVVQGLIVFNWVLLFVFLIGLILVFDPLGHHHHIYSANNHNGEIGFEQRSKLWEIRCRFLCCSCCSNPCRSGRDDVNDAFTDVAGVLTSVFHDMDLVPSDIAAGLLLLHLRTKRDREEIHHRRDQPVITSENVSTTSSPVNDNWNFGTGPTESNPPSLVSVSPAASSENTLGLASPSGGDGTSNESRNWMNPASAGMFMKYAFGTYGWMWYLYGGFWKGLCNIKNGLVCCSCCRGDSLIKNDADNCCHCNLAALKTVTKLEDKDIFHVSFHNSIYEVPYFVATDHQMASVVVAIRGTLSGHDALTDLAAVTDPIDGVGLPQGWTAHRGMLQTANFLLRQLEESNVLQQAFAQYPNYRLVITGHSLGAGVAVLLSLLLKPRYPNLRCFAFSPPGGLLCLAAARFTESFCMSVIIGDDLVPRLSLSNLELLKQQLVNELEYCQHPKYRIFLRGCWEVIFGSPHSYQPLGTTHPLLGDSSNNESINGPSSNVNRPASITREPMCLPGRILQVDQREPVDQLSDLHDQQYEVRWTQREDYSSIVVSPRMMSDHVPNYVTQVLQGLAVQYESSPHQLI